MARFYLKATDRSDGDFETKSPGIAEAESMTEALRKALLLHKLGRKFVIIDRDLEITVDFNALVSR